MADPSRRKAQRFDVVDVDGSFVVRIDVRVVNLSIGGMAIETSNTLIVGRTYTFRIGVHERELEVDGTVMWCVLGTTRPADGDEVSPIYRAGVRFEDVLDDQLQELTEIIEERAEVSPQEEIVGRFVAIFGGSIGIDEQTTFEVLRLSLSGMLVETDLAPRKHEVIPFEARLGERMFTGRARVAYIEPLTDVRGSQRFRLGLEFTLLSDRARSRLEEFLGELVAANVDQAVG